MVSGQHTKACRCDQLGRVRLVLCEGTRRPVRDGKLRSIVLSSVTLGKSAVEGPREEEREGGRRVPSRLARGCAQAHRNSTQ